MANARDGNDEDDEGDEGDNGDPELAYMELMASLPASYHKPFNQPTTRRYPRRTLELANVVVTKYLAKYAKDVPDTTVRVISSLTNIPKSTVAKTPAWIAFARSRKEQRLSKSQPISLSPMVIDNIHVTVPEDSEEIRSDEDFELRLLIEDQKKDQIRDQRRAKTRR